MTQINDSNKLYDILRYLYYLYGVLKRHRIFYKNEKNNLSSGAYHNDYFAISKKVLKTLEKVM
jgi:hypothetical protein